MSDLGYNERAWAIDLISEANAFLRDSPQLGIARAGGEHTLRRSGHTSRYPDVILFVSSTPGAVLMGWELKFPDTAITDSTLLQDAIDKADRLRTNAFLVWNVSAAVLYRRGEDGMFRSVKQWNDLHDIRSRGQVAGSIDRWRDVLHTILLDIAAMLHGAELEHGTPAVEVVDSSLADLVTQYELPQRHHLADVASRVRELDDSVTNWWHWSATQYPEAGGDKWLALSRLTLTSWLNKILFAHIVKRWHPNARAIEDLLGSSSPLEASALIARIAATCDFQYLFGPQLGEEWIVESAWKALLDINVVIAELQIDTLPDQYCQMLLSNSASAIRNVTGQFVTPSTLAELLVRAAIDDKHSDVLDPCCGSGTIVRASMDLKAAYGVGPDERTKTTWLSDKFSYPLQTATLSMADPTNANLPVQAFEADACDLRVGDRIRFFDPADGSPIDRALPQMGAIVSNLPFVPQEVLRRSHPTALSIGAFVVSASLQTAHLDSRSDLYAYLPFVFWGLLADDGTMGIITSNSWLATAWGESYRRALQQFFQLNVVVISGVERWFRNADVVTTVLIAKKRPRVLSPEEVAQAQEKCRFAVQVRTLDDVSGDLDVVAAALRSATARHEAIRCQDYSPADIGALESLGAQWSSLFADLKWLLVLRDELVPCSTFFDIARGERRGWNALFYPASGHGIEERYIRPVLRSISEVTGLIAAPHSEAFCCDQSIEALETYGHSGALAWIRRFEAQVNGNGDPLPEVLRQGDLAWYSMSDRTMADLVVGMAYDKRLFVPRLQDRAFVDQRLIRLTHLADAPEIGLLHALLNSTLGMLYLEMLGHGRGLGALDLSATRLADGLHILDARRLTPPQATRICDRFRVLCGRAVLPITDELAAPDRGEFDREVFAAFGIADHLVSCRSALLALHQIRTAVANN